MTPETELGSSPGKLRSNRELWLVLLLLTALYVIAVAFGNRRYVWFDELFTFDIARAPSLQQLWHWEVRFDNHTPTAYLLSRLSMAIFGPTPFGLRFPSMAEFYLGSIAMLFYVRRKASLSFAVLAVLLLWAVAPGLYYAVEARSYALIFFSFSMLLFSWDTAIRTSRRGLALTGIALSTFVLTVAHMFAAFTLSSFVCAEAFRLWRRRRPDYPLWASLFVPMLGALIYIPLIPATRIIVFAFPASLHTLGRFYMDALGVPVLALVLLLLVLFSVTTETTTTDASFLPEEITLLVCLLLNPVWLNLFLIVRRGTFYDRYCLTTQVALLVAIAIMLPRRIRFNRWAAYAASLVLILSLLKTEVHQRFYSATPRNAAFLEAIHPNLPIVVGEGQVFAEMNHYESPALLARLYYLKDRQASLRISHTNFFQDFEAPDAMQAAGFPYAAHVSTYRDFLQHQHQFLLLSIPDRYVFNLLHAQGASFTFLGDYRGSMPYLDTTLYLVTLPPQ